MKGCILFTTLGAYPLGRWWGNASATLVNFKGVFAAPDFSLLFQLDLVHSLQFIQGIICGFLSRTDLKLVIGKMEDVSVALLVIDAFPYTDISMNNSLSMLNKRDTNKLL